MKNFLALPLAALMFLSGCIKTGSIYSNYRELADLQIVRTIGIDKTEDGICVTVSSGPNPTGNMVISQNADSVTQAIDLLQNYASDKELFYAHTQYIIFGSETSTKDIGEYLGYIERSTDIRMGVSLFALKNGSAEDLIAGSGGEDRDITQVLEAIEREVTFDGSNHVFSCTDIARALSEHGAAFICTLDAVGTEGAVHDAEPVVNAVCSGFGIIKNGKIIGYLNSNEASAVCMLLGYSGSLRLSADDGEGGRISLVVDSTSTDIQVIWDGDSPAGLSSETEISAVISEMDRLHFEIDDELLDNLGKNLSDKITSELNSVFEKEKSLKADFLGLGNAFRAENPKAFDSLSAGWPGDIVYMPSVSVKVGRSYDLRNSISKDGNGSNGTKQ